jgi:queuine tRNA-ribosyltransferase
MNSLFKSSGGEFPLPIFFPDATRGVVKSLDTTDLEGTKTLGILVNTFHLWQEVEPAVFKRFGGIGNFMGFDGGIISDSGGFQVMSLIKSGKLNGKITNEGVVFYPSRNNKKILTPEKSIEFQMRLRSDMVIVLDDFTDPNSSYREAEISVERTINWAKRSKSEFLKICRREKLSAGKRPYILGVVQGDKYQDLRKYCAQRLAEIGFDGFGFGGWPLDGKGNFDLRSAKTISENAPRHYYLYGLGVGKPEDIVASWRLGFNIFDCVLPTRDARHGRLYIYNATSMSKIDLNKQDFYSCIDPAKKKYIDDTSPVSTACDCILCRKYSRAYLAHLFKIGDFTAGRLATIHNLRFYSIFMDKLRLTNV